MEPSAFQPTTIAGSGGFLAKDLEVIVLTYNRADFLGATLKSVFDQSISGFTVTVLDNASSDHTAEVVASFVASGCRHIRNEVNLGGIGNFSKAMTLSDRSWVLLFHDDDLMAPHYLETLLTIVNLYPDLSLVGSGYREFSNEVRAVPFLGPAVVSRPLSIGEFAGELISGQPLAFCSVLYRTDRLRNQTLKSQAFGKISDVPLLFSVIGDGTGAIIRSPMINYRIHPGRDSVAVSSGPFLAEVLNLNREYRHWLATRKFSIEGRRYFAAAFNFLANSRSWIPRETRPNLPTFLALALRGGAITVGALAYGLTLNWLWKGLRKVFMAPVSRETGRHGDTILPFSAGQ